MFIAHDHRPTRSESTRTIIRVLNHSSCCVLNFMLPACRPNCSVVVRTTWRLSGPALYYGRGITFWKLFLHCSGDCKYQTAKLAFSIRSMLEASGSFETSLHIYQTTRCDSQEFNNVTFILIHNFNTWCSRSDLFCKVWVFHVGNIEDYSPVEYTEVWCRKDLSSFRQNCGFRFEKSLNMRLHSVSPQ
jgi:hypothetical protein